MGQTPHVQGWSPSQFEFQPYELKAERLVEDQQPLALEGGKRKAGRQKRSSILCQVEGCGVELINEKTYYKRYRICSEHCVMPLMVIDGRRQRFCQQCGRFHDISEFEGQRKSCRRKLKRHNERRRSGPTKGRKWQSDSDDEYSVDDGEGEAEIVAKIKRTSVRMRSGRSKGLATSSEDVSESTPCPTEPLAPAGAPSDKQPPQLRSLAERLLHAARDMVGLPAESVSPFAAVAGQPAASADTSQDGSNPVAMLTSAIGTATDGEAVGEPSTQLDGLEDISLLDLEMYANGCYTDATDLLLLPEDPSDSLVLTGAAASTRTGSVHPNTEALPEQVFNNVPSVNGPLNHGILPPLPNIGPSQEQPVTAHLVPPESMHVGGSYGAFDALPVDAMGSGLHYQDVAMMTGRSPFVLPTMSMPAGSAYGGHLSTMQHAASMVSYASAPVVDYCSDERLTRMSLKVFNATPDQLMPNVRQEIENLLRVSATVLEGYIRPGCVHVTIDARVSAGAPGVAAGGELLQAMQNILDRDALGPEASDDMLVQTGGELIVVKKRRVVAVINTVQSASVMPNITSVRPLAVAATSGRRTPALLVGERIAADGAVVMCRQGGRNITVEMKDTPVRHGERDVVQVALLGLRPGCAEVEVQTGAFLGNARPLLVLPDEAAVKEIRQLETAGRKGIAVADTDSFLRDMGFVVQYICRDAAKTQGFPLPTYTPQLVDTIQRVACRLVAAAAARSWTAVVRMLLPAVTAGQSHAAAAAAMNACCPSGFSLLHVAVGTGNAVVVKELIGWAAAAGPDAGIPWAVDARGPAGVTPLHVAALLPEAVRAAMRAELTALSSAVDKMWSLTLCDEGSSPEMMAEQFSAGMPSSTSNSDATAFVARESEAKKELAAESISAAGGPVMKPLMDKGENGEWVPSEQDLPPDRQMHRRKARGIIKRQLDDLHIGVLMSEVGSLPQADVVAVPGGLWASTMGTAVAMGMGFAAVLLHALA